MSAVEYVDAGAEISRDGKYRYRLWREWRLWPDAAKWRWFKDEKGRPILDGKGAELGEPQTCVFVMLNPSTADGEQDDPTIRRCVGFARAWGYDRLLVLNLFAYRATDPATLLALNDDDDPVGPRNIEVFEHAVESFRPSAGWGSGAADIAVCAWGAHGRHLGQDDTALGWLAPLPTFALGLTKDGSPSHPLYVKASTPLQPFNPRPRT